MSSFTCSVEEQHSAWNLAMSIHLLSAGKLHAKSQAHG